MRPPRSPGAALPIAALRGYQRWISPFLTPRCRFYPSCSEYAARALSAHGLRSGSWLALRRVLRCQPFADGGLDPVPDTPASRRPPVPSASSTAATGASS